MNLIIFSLSMSIFDSLATTQQIIIFVLLLTTNDPIRNALCYLAGLSLSYFICGIVGYQIFDKVSSLFIKSMPSSANLPNSTYYQSELLSGIVMVVIGIWYFRRKRHASKGRSQNRILAKLQSINWFMAFFIGIFISVTSFPFAIPYLIALGKYTSLHLSFNAVAGHLLLYNIGYALPMIIIFVVYFISRSKTAEIADIMHEKARILNVQLTTWAFAGAGLFSMLDAIFYFVAGRPLINGRYF